MIIDFLIRTKHNTYSCAIIPDRADANYRADAADGEESDANLMERMLIR
jgi:hypothetical protein